MVIAANQVKPLTLIAFPKQTLSKVIELFRQHPDASYLPVLDQADHGRLLGFSSQNDVLAAFRRI